MPPEGCLGHTLVQQMDQERRQRLSDPLAHQEICGRDVPGSGPVLQLRTSLGKTLLALRLETERALGAAK